MNRASALLLLGILSNTLFVLVSRRSGERLGDLASGIWVGISLGLMIWGGVLLRRSRTSRRDGAVPGPVDPGGPAIRGQNCDGDS